MKLVSIWIGNFGSYTIPEHLMDVQMTKSGFPDRRCKKANIFLKWVEDQESLAVEEMKLDAACEAALGPCFK
jgi:hypothetical protein